MFKHDAHTKSTSKMWTNSAHTDGHTFWHHQVNMTLSLCARARQVRICVVRLTVQWQWTMGLHTGCLVDKASPRSWLEYSFFFFFFVKEKMLSATAASVFMRLRRHIRYVWSANVCYNNQNFSPQHRNGWLTSYIKSGTLCVMGVMFKHAFTSQVVRILLR